MNILLRIKFSIHNPCQYEISQQYNNYIFVTTILFSKRVTFVIYNNNPTVSLFYNCIILVWLSIFVADIVFTFIRNTMTSLQHFT